MKSLEDLVITAPEMVMKHYDRSAMTEQARQQQDLAAKEASYAQAVGYPVTHNISCQEWEDMVSRNERSLSYGGTYVQKPDPGRSGSMV